MTTRTQMRTEPTERYLPRVARIYIFKSVLGVSLLSTDPISFFAAEVAAIGKGGCSSYISRNHFLFSL